MDEDDTPPLHPVDSRSMETAFFQVLQLWGESQQTFSGLQGHIQDLRAALQSSHDAEALQSAKNLNELLEKIRDTQNSNKASLDAHASKEEAVSSQILDNQKTLLERSERSDRRWKSILDSLDKRWGAFIAGMLTTGLPLGIYKVIDVLIPAIQSLIKLLG